jgi:hypothetical protein
MGKPKVQKRTRPLMHITLSPEAIARFAELAERSGRSRSAWVEQWIRDERLPPPLKSTP